jgi:hypothetical protein
MHALTSGLGLKWGEGGREREREMEAGVDVEMYFDSIV